MNATRHKGEVEVMFGGVSDLLRAAAVSRRGESSREEAPPGARLLPSLKGAQ